LALLELGSSLAGTITKKSGVHRKNVYDALERLMGKGLVSFIDQNNRKYYQPSNPIKIKDLLEERDIMLNNILPDLIKDYHSSREDIQIKIFKGKTGLKTLYYDVIKDLKQGLGYYVIGARDVSPFIGRTMDIVHKKRIQKQIYGYFLYTTRFKARASVAAKLKYTRVAILPRGFPSLVHIMIIGHKTAQIIFSDEPTAIVIINNEIAQSYLEYFKFLLNISKRL